MYPFIRIHFTDLSLYFGIVKTSIALFVNGRYINCFCRFR